MSLLYSVDYFVWRLCKWYILTQVTPCQQVVNNECWRPNQFTSGCIAEMPMIHVSCQCVFNKASSVRNVREGVLLFCQQGIQYSTITFRTPWRMNQLIDNQCSRRRLQVAGLCGIRWLPQKRRKTKKKKKKKKHSGIVRQESRIGAHEMPPTKNMSFHFEKSESHRSRIQSNTPPAPFPLLCLPELDSCCLKCAKPSRPTQPRFHSKCHSRRSAGGSSPSSLCSIHRQSHGAFFLAETWKSTTQATQQVRPNVRRYHHAWFSKL